MATGTVNSRYFILGLLTRQPMSGYDIKKFISSLSWLIGSPSAGSLYPALRALLEEGLATVEVIPSSDKPPRKVYSITDSGRHALQEWIDQPVTVYAPLRAFVMRLILAENFTRPALIDHLRHRRAQVADHQAVLERTAGELDVEPDLGQRLAIHYGLAIASAELDCLDDMLERLTNEPPPKETIESERIATA